MLTSLVSLQQGNVNKSKKLMKIVDIEEENLHIFWASWRISMKFSEKMRLMIILLVTKKHDPFSEKHIFGKTTAFLGLKYLFAFCIISYLLCRSCYKIIPCWPMLGQCYLLVLPEDIRKFSDVFGVQQIGHWLNMGSCFLYFSLTRIRSVLYGIDF